MTKIFSPHELIDIARNLEIVARAAGEIERYYYHAGAEVIDKADGSPVTKADQEAEALVTAELAKMFPDIALVGEEAVASGTIPDISSGTFFLVDPLDGTKEFITGGGDFTVNIALLQNFRPVMGVIYAPVSDQLWYGAQGAGSFYVPALGGAVRPMAARPVPDAGLTVVTSRRHGDPEAIEHFLKGRKVAETLARSSSLKFCAIGMGEADIYPRLGPTSEWDTAAGEAILHAAGGRVTQLDGQAMVYGKSGQKFLNPSFVASGL